MVWKKSRQVQQFKVTSSQQATFQISSAAHWPLRNVCSQRIHDEPTGGKGALPAGCGDVSKNPRNIINIAFQALK